MDFSIVNLGTTLIYFRQKFGPLLSDEFKLFNKQCLLWNKFIDDRNSRIKIRLWGPIKPKKWTFFTFFKKRSMIYFRNHWFRLEGTPLNNFNQNIPCTTTNRKNVVQLHRVYFCRKCRFYFNPICTIFLTKIEEQPFKTVIVRRSSPQGKRNQRNLQNFILY